MNWYFAISESSLDRPGHDWRNMIRVAVHSAMNNTQLVPHMIFDGPENDLTRELSLLGVKVIFHRVSIYDSLMKYGKNIPDYLPIASGAFLRFDIPFIEMTAKYVLYTDCDVLFLTNPDFGNAAEPLFFAATAQAARDPLVDMNSGVMLINVEAMRAISSELISFTKKNLHLGLDQEILREYSHGKYTPMDLVLNWKPYWGVNPAAQIIHFHGPKPTLSNNFILTVIAEMDPIWKSLYSNDPVGYAVYNRLWVASLTNFKQYSSMRHIMSTQQQQLEKITRDRDHWKALASR
jgi:hypothetical protein